MPDPQPNASSAPATPAARDTVPEPPRLRILLLAAGRAAEGAWWGDLTVELGRRGHAVLVVAPAGSVALERPLAVRVPVRATRIDRAWDPRPGRVLAGATRLLRPEAVLVDHPAVLRHLPRGATAPVFLYRRSSDEAIRLAARSRLELSGLLASEVRAEHRAQVFAVAEGIPERGALRRELRLPRRPRIALVVGSLRPESGIDLVLRAWQALGRDAVPGFAWPVLAVLGTGPEESNLRVLSHELGIKEHVTWLGHERRTESYVAASDLLLAPRAGFDSRAWEAGRRCRVPALALEPLASDPQIWAAAVRGALAQDAAAPELRRCSAERLGDEIECLVHATLLGRAGLPRGALFVDRDGTLVGNVPYNCDPDALVLEPDVGPALRLVQRAGLAIAVVSNQSAVARGLCTAAQVEAVHTRLRELLHAEGVRLDAIEFCPHHPDHGPPCRCRKPEPGMLLEVAARLGVDLLRSVTVGDEERDLEAGKRAGTRVRAYAGDWIAVARDVLGACRGATSGS